jgi:hypothetical protein
MSLNLHPLFVSFKFEIKLVSDSLDNMTTILKPIENVTFRWEDNYICFHITSFMLIKTAFLFLFE